MAGDLAAEFPDPVKLAVDVSYDDGATWRPAELRRTADGGTAVVHHPAGPGYVSLRATATDSAGNNVTVSRRLPGRPWSRSRG